MVHIDQIRQLFAKVNQKRGGLGARVVGFAQRTGGVGAQQALGVVAGHVIAHGEAVFFIEVAIDFKKNVVLLATTADHLVAFGRVVDIVSGVEEVFHVICTIAVVKDILVGVVTQNVPLSGPVSCDSVDAVTKVCVKAHRCLSAIGLPSAQEVVRPDRLHRHFARNGSRPSRGIGRPLDHINFFEHPRVDDGVRVVVKDVAILRCAVNCNTQQAALHAPHIDLLCHITPTGDIHIRPCSKQVIDLVALALL
ncbi:hypothetical protein BN341_16350 [Helicobacter heilmannii ASB1.4]|nr:hypothetical protein BN341_16350 [Helicobacter heilmannii ASB1.4]